MGNDGGSVAKRSDLVAKPAKPAAKSRPTDVWTVCALSGQPLTDPVVSDWQGRLYSKEAVLELLVGERARPEACDISSTRDVVSLVRTVEKGRWICPLSQLDVVSEGSGRAVVYIVPCGHCGDERALVADGKCGVCGAAASEDAVVALNPRDLAPLRARRDRLHAAGRSHSLARTRKRRLSDGTPKPKAKKA